MSKLYENAVDRLTEEQLFEMAAAEIANDVVRPGLWAQALAISEGDENKAKAKYLILRVQAMKDEALVLALKEAEEENKKQDERKRQREMEKRKVAEDKAEFQHLKKQIESFSFLVTKNSQNQPAFCVTQGVWFGKPLHFNVQNLSELRRFAQLLQRAKHKGLFLKMAKESWIINELGRTGARATLADLDEAEAFVDGWRL